VHPLDRSWPIAPGRLTVDCVGRPIGVDTIVAIMAVPRLVEEPWAMLVSGGACGNGARVARHHKTED
jgi:hypothetical protein